MARTNRGTPTEEIPKRQKAICEAVIVASGNEGAGLLRGCNSALRAAGLPTIENKDDFCVVMNCPPTNRSIVDAVRDLIRLEMFEILRASPNYAQDKPMAEMAAGMRMTLEQVWIIARQSVIDEFVSRGIEPNDHDAIIALCRERQEQYAA